MICYQNFIQKHSLKCVLSYDNACVTCIFVYILKLNAKQYNYSQQNQVSFLKSEIINAKFHDMLLKLHFNTAIQMCFEKMTAFT